MEDQHKKPYEAEWFCPQCEKGGRFRFSKSPIYAGLAAHSDCPFGEKNLYIKELSPEWRQNGSGRKDK